MWYANLNKYIVVAFVTLLQITDENLIKDHIKEANTRIELGRRQVQFTYKLYVDYILCKKQYCNEKLNTIIC